MAYIKFFNGEKENPFEGKDQNKMMLWDYERGYTFTKSEQFLIDEYHCYVKNFQEKDGIPEGFKALLFNRFMKDAYSISDSIPAFKKFYKKYYG